MKRKWYLFTAVVLFRKIIFTQHPPLISNYTGHSATRANLGVVYYPCHFTIDPDNSKNI